MMITLSLSPVLSHDAKSASNNKPEREGESAKGGSPLTPKSGKAFDKNTELSDERAGEIAPADPGSGSATAGLGTLGFMCFDAIQDQASSNCLTASSIPTLGR
ncbi:MAG: hypothetical protein ACI835_004994 [Planctomycetota bacterium]|jgi:hypothetical protein